MDTNTHADRYYREPHIRFLDREAHSQTHIYTPPFIFSLFNIESPCAIIEEGTFDLILKALTVT